MRKLFISAIIAFTAITSGLYAQETEKASPKVDLQVVYEKNFDDTIVDVIFDTVTVGIEEAKRMGWKDEAFKKREKEVTVPYPKVLFVGKLIRPLYLGITDIKFYNTQANLKKSINVGVMERVDKSDDGRYILVAKQPDDFRPESQGGKLYDSNGKLLREFTKYFPVAVSNEGYVIAGEVPYESEAPGDFVFYNPQGREVGRVYNPLKDIDAGWAEAKFTEDQEYIIVGYTDFSKSALIIVHKEGSVLWQRIFDQDAFHLNSEVTGLKDTGIGGISQDKTGVYSYFFDWAGNLKRRIPLEIRGNMIVTIMENKKRVNVVSSVGYMWCIDLVDGKVTWKHRESWSPDPKDKTWPRDVPRFRELEVINDTLYIIGRSGHSSTLFVFDGESGSLIEKIEYPNEKITFSKTYREIGLINTTQGKILMLKKEILK